MDLIQVGHIVVERDKIETDEFFELLSKEDPKLLASSLIEMSLKNESNITLNSTLNTEIMRRKKGVGGITIDE